MRTMLRDQRQENLTLLSPKCQGCDQAWPCPREIKINYKQELPKLPPYTPECVVPYQCARNDMPDAVFENLQYRKHVPCFGDMLVTDFQYSQESGELFYDMKSEELPDIRYARLITLSSWYKSLFGAMLYCMLFSMDIQANLSLAAQMYTTDGPYSAYPLERDIFMVLWLGSILVTLFIAYREASWEWNIKAGALVGDIIQELHWVDRVWCFFCLVMLRFFLVEMEVKDIVTLLHPWKAMQPFAAFKMENARGYAVGYKSYDGFQTENTTGQQLILPMQFLTKFALMVFKGYLAFHMVEDTLFYTLAASSGSNCVTVIMLCVTMFYVAKSRGRYFEQLMSSATASPGKAAGQQSEGAVNVQRTQCKKLLAMHFHVVLDDNNTARWVGMKQYMDRSQSNITGCQKCGRSPEDVECAATSARLKQATQNLERSFMTVEAPKDVQESQHAARHSDARTPGAADLRQPILHTGSGHRVELMPVEPKQGEAVAGQSVGASAGTAAQSTTSGKTTP